MIIPENLWEIYFIDGKAEISYSSSMIKWLNDFITNYKLNVKTSMITETIEDNSKIFKINISVEIDIPNNKEKKMFTSKWY